jgi:hypothetical protein
MGKRLRETAQATSQSNVSVKTDARFRSTGEKSREFAPETRLVEQIRRICARIRDDEGSLSSQKNGTEHLPAAPGT